MQRSANLKGEIIQERYLEAGDLDEVVGVRLSFTKNTELVGFKNNLLFSIIISPDGEVQKHQLLELKLDNIIYNIWTPQIIDYNRYLIRMGGEKFNGWAVVDTNEVLECFIKYGDDSCYTDIISNMVIELPKSAQNNYVICGLRVNNNVYQVAIYNSEEESQLYIVSRPIS
ncbi:hypothetical protein ASG99_27920 [Bacillus sp. Soil768D1]|nr:hypothetical protein ASG99_27920 [Bacillus sp. Soil768D1]